MISFFFSYRDPNDVLSLFITPELVNLIVCYTNQKIQEKHADSALVSYDEIRSFLGLLLIVGALDDNKLPINFLFSTNFGSLIYRAATSRDRFKFILQNLRFDNVNLRSFDNVFHPFEEVSKIFLNSFGKYWSPSESIVIDEQMVSFNGRFKYKVYQPAKPIKRGIMMRSICDAFNRYLLKFDVYIGKKEPLYDQMANLLDVSNVINSNRTLVTDNFYTSIDHSERFFTNYKLNTVGTMRINKPHIPEYLKSIKDRQVKSSNFLFTPPNSNLEAM